MGHMQQQQHPLIDPGSMVAMAQVRPPTLEGLNIKQIKTFKLAYRRYVSKVPVPQWIRLPGQLVLPEQLITIATLNNIGDIEDLKRMPEEQFFMCLCRIHNATMTTQWCRLLEQVKMTTQTWSLEFYLEYVEDFRFQMAIAGRDFQPPESEVVKIFIRGLQPNTLQTEIRRKNLETLEEVIDETSDVIVRYKAIFDLTDSMVKSPTSKKTTNSKKASSKATEEVSTDTADKVAAVAVAPPKKSKGDSSDKKKEVTCYKCLQKGHLAPNCPNPKHPRSTWQPRTARAIKKSEESEVPAEQPTARSIRVFSSDMQPSSDTFIRLDVSVFSPADETLISPLHYKTSVFLDSGANLNSITREFFSNGL